MVIRQPIMPPMKNHHHNGPLHPTSRGVIHEAIASRAYQLWTDYGQPENQAVAIWLEAESEMATGSRKIRPSVALPVSF